MDTALLRIVMVSAALYVGGCAKGVDGRVLVVGHRGAPSLTAENSIEGFALARDLGADGVEFDVQLTADGHSVVMHDGTLDRTTTCMGRVAEYTLAELQDCRLANGEPVRTLDETLAIIGDWFVVIFVEVKGDGFGPMRPRVDTAIEIVKRSPHPERIVMISTDGEALRRIAERSEQDRLTGGWDADFGDESIALAVEHGMPIALLPMADLRQSHGDAATALGLRLCVYGVNSQTEYEDAIESGVDIILTDALQAFAPLTVEERSRTQAQTNE